MGWLSEEVERSLSAWLHAEAVDLPARGALEWRRNTYEGDQLTNHLSIRQLLDQIEGKDEHVLYVFVTEWKMQHPLRCRMTGLAHCRVVAPENLRPGTYTLQEGTWLSNGVDSSSP